MTIDPKNTQQINKKSVSNLHAFPLRYLIHATVSSHLLFPSGKTKNKKKKNIFATKLHVQFQFSKLKSIENINYNNVEWRMDICILVALRGNWDLIGLLLLGSCKLYFPGNRITETNTNENDTTCSVLIFCTCFFLTSLLD